MRNNNGRETGYALWVFSSTASGVTCQADSGVAVSLTLDAGAL